TRRRGFLSSSRWTENLLRLLLVAALLERRAENVAKRRTRIGGAILRDGFLLLGHFQRLDRHLHLAGLAVELGDAGVDLLADLEPLRALIAAIAGKVGTANEGFEVGAGDLHVETALLHVGDLAG